MSITKTEIKMKPQS